MTIFERYACMTIFGCSLLCGGCPKGERLAEDITSEAFFRALRRIDSFRGDYGDIRVWLCQIAKNCYYTHLKQSRWTDVNSDMRKL